MNKKAGRPKEKGDASKITLYLEDTIIATLNALAKQNKTSRSKVIEGLVAQCSKEENVSLESADIGTSGKLAATMRVVEEAEKEHQHRTKSRGASK